MVKLEEFFNFKSKEPINRLAYTEEDMKYKIKIIEKMQELGMQVTVDKIGNICGTIAIGNNPEKTLAIGSHTDSVYNGGQYDGVAGVIAGLQTAEQLIKNNKTNGTIKVAIYACEESSRFGSACIGSKYLSGNLTEEQLDIYKDEKAFEERGELITLREAIQEAKTYLQENTKGVKEVDKIFEKDEIDYSLESHIEQDQSLNKKYKKDKKEIIGIVNCIGSAVRVQYEVKGKSGHTGSTPMDKRKNAVDGTAYIGVNVVKLGKKYEKQGIGRASQVEINTINHNRSFNQLSASSEGLIDFRLLGENKPEEVLQDFEKIVKKVEKKTRTKIKTTIVSKGNPIITDSKLNKKIAQVCEQEGIEYVEMPSYAGQDTGYVPAKQKTMIFIPSKGGSHKPKETTQEKFIETSVKVLVGTAEKLLKERFKDSYKHEVKMPKITYSQEISKKEKSR